MAHKSPGVQEDSRLLPSHGIFVDVPQEDGQTRPPLVKHLSGPAYESPIRHHRRVPSSHHEVKETLNARSEYTTGGENGAAQHRINQYIMKEEIGRGSFGAVHLAVDQYGTEYAVKEFSKSRLRKRAQSNILRKPREGRPINSRPGEGHTPPLSKSPSWAMNQGNEGDSPLSLIKEEIAIMKKLHHSNLVELIEVLDDPAEDSLYMVLEMCKKGVIMKVGLGERADPYDEDCCRCWFRDLILGIEYLHAQGVIHRDIKPDNLLLTDDDVLKIVDFGVSEMFEKNSEMLIAKSAGSPAFLPPELCVARHGNISGKAADIWAMGVTLYCLRFGRIPFERSSVMELYEAIKNDEPEFEPDADPQLRDLLCKLLEKDPSRRIQMCDLRVHPWVIQDGQDELLTVEENTAELVGPATEEEVNAAITGNLNNLIVVMKAVRKFKNLLAKKRPIAMENVLDYESRSGKAFITMPAAERGKIRRKSRSLTTDNRRPIGQALAVEGVHLAMDQSEDRHHSPDEHAGSTPPRKPSPRGLEGRADHRLHKSYTAPVDQPGQPVHRHHHGTVDRGDTGKGHAHDPLQDHLFLNIGWGGTENEGQDSLVLSESPSLADINIYETAYQDEVQKILRTQGGGATIYSTRRVEPDTSQSSRKNSDGIKKAQDKGGDSFAKALEQVRAANR